MPKLNNPKVHDLKSIKAKYADKGNIDKVVDLMAGKLADALISSEPKKKESSWTDILQHC